MEKYINFIFPEEESSCSVLRNKQTNKQTLDGMCPFLEQKEEQNDRESLIVMAGGEKKEQNPVHMWTGGFRYEHG